MKEPSLGLLLTLSEFCAKKWSFSPEDLREMARASVAYIEPDLDYAAKDRPVRVLRPPPLQRRPTRCGFSGRHTSDAPSASGGRSQQSSEFRTPESAFLCAIVRTDRGIHRQEHNLLRRASYRSRKNLQKNCAVGHTRKNCHSI
jgi:hypothetical protein